MLVVMRELAEHFPINTALRYCRNVARRSSKPTIIVKANIGMRSWLKRWI